MTMERTIKNIELRVNDVIRLEESIYKLHGQMVLTATHINNHVRVECILI